MNMSVLAECSWGACLRTPAFGYGAIAGVVVAILIWCAMRLFSGPRASAPAITVVDDTVGTFSVSTAAIKTFVQRIVVHFPTLELKSVAIMQSHDGKALDIQLLAQPDCNLSEARSQLREKIFQSLETQLGITGQIKEINIEIADFNDKADVAASPKG